MKYSKIEKDNYNLHILKTNKFKTITIRINLKRKLIKEEITKRNLLCNVLIESTMKYNTRRLVDIKTEDLYDLQYISSINNSGTASIFCIEATFINPKYTEEHMYEESFEFINQLLFNPNVIDNKFSDKAVLNSKNYLKEKILKIKDDSSMYSQIRLFDTMADSVVSYHSNGYIEDLDKVTGENLYDYYKDIFANDIVDIFIIGDVDNSNIEKLVDKYLVFKTNKKDKINHFYEYDSINKTIDELVEKQDNLQSNLLVGFKIDKLSFFEKKYVMYVFNNIFGGGTDSNLFNSVREKESLCYSIYTLAYPIVSTMVLKAGINAKNYDKTILLIKEELEKMQKGKFDEVKVINSITSYVNGMSEVFDDQDGILGFYMAKEYLNSETLDKRLKQIKKVTKEDVVKLANKVHLTNIFLLEGNATDEEE